MLVPSLFLYRKKTPSSSGDSKAPLFRGIEGTLRRFLFPVIPWARETGISRYPPPPGSAAGRPLRVRPETAGGRGDPGHRAPRGPRDDRSPARGRRLRDATITDDPRLPDPDGRRGKSGPRPRRELGGKKPDRVPLPAAQGSPVPRREEAFLGRRARHLRMDPRPGEPLPPPARVHVDLPDRNPRRSDRPVPALGAVRAVSRRSGPRDRAARGPRVGLRAAGRSRSLPDRRLPARRGGPPFPVRRIFRRSS